MGENCKFRCGIVNGSSGGSFYYWRDSLIKYEALGRLFSMFTLLKLRELRMMGIRSSGKDRSGKPAVGKPVGGRTWSG